MSALEHKQEEQFNHSSPSSVSVSRSRSTIQLGTFEKLCLVGCVIVSIVAVFVTMEMKMTMSGLNHSIDSYEQQTHDLNQQTDEVMNEITTTDNYDHIQKAAKEEGMSIDKSRIRSIENKD